MSYKCHVPGYVDQTELDDRAARRFVPHVVGVISRRKSNFVEPKPSPFKGVSYDKARDKWEAYWGGGSTKRIKLGRYDTAAQAAGVVWSFLCDNHINQ